MDADLEQRGIAALRRERIQAERAHRAYIRLIDQTLSKLCGSRPYERVRADATPCEHTDQRIIARGMCNPCYQRWYYRERVKGGA